MKQPWHTEGYLKLAHALVHLVTQQVDDYSADVDAAIKIVARCGKLIRQENPRESIR